MKNDILFSIIIPAFNRSYILKRTIVSVLNQDYPNYEIIVVDDGSTDNTEDIISSIKDSRLFYFKKQNEERGAARNFGAKIAKGDYVNFIDSDDYVYPNHLSLAVKNILDLKMPEIFYLNYEIRTNDMKLLKKGPFIQGDLNLKLLKKNLLSSNGVFIRRDIILQHPFNENRDLSGTEDWLLWLQLASRYKFHYSNNISHAMIQHDNRSVLNITEISLLNRKNLLIKYISEDSVFMQKYRQHLNSIETHMLTYIALHLTMSGKSMMGIYYLIKAGKKNFRELFQKRTLAIIKHILINIFKK